MHGSRARQQCTLCLPLALKKKKRNRAGHAGGGAGGKQRGVPRSSWVRLRVSTAVVPVCHRLQGLCSLFSSPLLSLSWVQLHTCSAAAVQAHRQGRAAWFLSNRSTDWGVFSRVCFSNSPSKSPGNSVSWERALAQLPHPRITSR